jgi:23S rRNA (cytidine1920-2'-O)/16S rRNA (cytidine1409-2'-O)-methyltransferase
MNFLEPGGDLLVMVKPQFEVGKGRVGKKGVVRDESLRTEVIAEVVASAEELGLHCLGQRDNDIRGPKGNLEAFIHLRA